MDAWETAHADYTHSSDLSDDFHKYGLEWTEEYIKTTIDGKTVLEFKHDQDMFTKGGFPENVNNPWKRETDKNAPFNQDFFLVFNVAVGGTNSYFPEGKCDKPWSNQSPHAVNEFWDNKDKWFPSWNYPASNDAAMKIDYVRIWQDDGKSEDPEFMQ